MTRAEFFDCLRESRKKFVWTICYGGSIRGLLNDATVFKNGSFCPITAVCVLKTGLIYGSSHFRNAANRLELDLFDSQLSGIPDAADQIRGVDLELRQELEEAIFGKVITQ